MDDIELAAQQFANHVRIGTFGVEQFDLVAQHVPLCRQFGKLGFALVQQTQIFAPREQPGRTGDGKTAHQQQSQKRKGLHPALASPPKESAFAFHDDDRITFTISTQASCALKRLRNLLAGQSVASLTRPYRSGI